MNVIKLQTLVEVFAQYDWTSQSILAEEQRCSPRQDVANSDYRSGTSSTVEYLQSVWDASISCITFASMENLLNTDSTSGSGFSK